MEIKLKNKNFIIITLGEDFRVNATYGSFYKSDVDGETDFCEDTFKNVDFMEFMKLLKVNCIGSANYILDYMKNNHTYIKIKNLNKKTTYSFVDMYTDEETLVSESFEDLEEEVMSLKNL
jgi:hypothetical protein